MTVRGGLYKYLLIRPLFQLIRGYQYPARLSNPHLEPTSKYCIISTPIRNRPLRNLSSSETTASTMALTKTTKTQPTNPKTMSSIGGGGTPEFVSMFPERPSGVSWADWVDDDEEEEMTAAPPVSPPKEQVADVAPRTTTTTTTTATTATKGERIETQRRKLSFDTEVPKPVLLNPSMKAGELGLTASRWANEEDDNEEEEVKVVAAQPEQPVKIEKATKHHDPPSSAIKLASPVVSPVKTVGPGLSASRWAT